MSQKSMDHEVVSLERGITGLSKSFDVGIFENCPVLKPDMKTYDNKVY